MNSIKYKEEIDLLKKQVNVELTSDVVGDYEKILVLSSANFSKVMPDIPTDRYENMCRDNFFYKRLSGIQLQYLKIIEDTKFAGNLDFTKDNSIPRIFCTFHMGSYRLINLALIKYNIDFVLVISKETLREQKEIYLKAYEDMKKLTGNNSSFEFIEAENPSSMVSMVKALKSGKSLLFYIDGNTGVGGVGKTDDKMIPVKLHNATIYTRKGISYLSHKFNIPIINCFTYIEDNNNIDKVTIQFNDPIYPKDGAEDIQEFSMVTTQRIYDEFSEVLTKHPAQWEGWMYLHRYMDLSVFNDLDKDISKELNLTDTFVYNKERFSSFTQGKQLYLFDKVTYNTYPINQEFKDILLNSSSFSSGDKTISDDIFCFLVNKKILTPTSL